MATGSKLIFIALRLSTKCIGGSSRATITSSRTASCRIRPTTSIFAGYRDFIRLVLRRTGKTRYLSKNNNHLLRLESLAKAFPDSVILIPIRDPRDHALSLLNQHKRFLDSDAFTRDYMGWLGHHEFGATHRPIAWDGAIAAGDPQSLRLLVVAVGRRASADRGLGSSAQEYPARPLSGADERCRHLACRGAPYWNRARAAQGDPLQRRSETGPSKSQRARSSTRRPNCTGALEQGRPRIPRFVLIRSIDKIGRPLS